MTARYAATLAETGGVAIPFALAHGWAKHNAPPLRAIVIDSHAISHSINSNRYVNANRGVRGAHDIRNIAVVGSSEPESLVTLLSCREAVGATPSLVPHCDVISNL